MTRPTTVALTLATALVVPRPVAAYTPPPAASYTRMSPDRAFVFVMLVPQPSGRPAQPDDPGRTYARSGLYRNDGSASLLWEYSGPYASDAWPASDGVHLVTRTTDVVTIQHRTCGNSPPDVPPNPDVLAVHAGGKKVRDVPLGDVLDHERFFREHASGWHGWLRAGRIDDAAGEFVASTVYGTKWLSLATGRPRYTPVAGDDPAAEPGLGPVEFGGTPSAGRGGVRALGLVLGGGVVVGTALVAAAFLRSRRPAG